MLLVQHCVWSLKNGVINCSTPDKPCGVHGIVGKTSDARKCYFLHHKYGRWQSTERYVEANRERGAIINDPLYIDLQATLAQVIICHIIV